MACCLACAECPGPWLMRLRLLRPSQLMLTSYSRDKQLWGYSLVSASWQDAGLIEATFAVQVRGRCCLAGWPMAAQAGRAAAARAERRVCSPMPLLHAPRPRTTAPHHCRPWSTASTRPRACRLTAWRAGKCNTGYLPPHQAPSWRTKGSACSLLLLLRPTDLMATPNHACRLRRLATDMILIVLVVVHCVLTALDVSRSFKVGRGALGCPKWGRLVGAQRTRACTCAGNAQRLSAACGCTSPAYLPTHPPTVSPASLASRPSTAGGGRCSSCWSCAAAAGPPAAMPPLPSPLLPRCA